MVNGLSRKLSNDNYNAPTPKGLTFTKTPLWGQEILIDMKRFIEFFQVSEVFGYFIRVFKKPDPSRPNTSSLRMMHGINRISIVMFLFCICVMLYRLFTR
ncbi:hypothetical protein Runsl_0384 [Runella slithyformis DSM 19594]|uniref:Uncharacterized protein n=2 Tax=Runella TaxID=105 RepID=A0A7U3ZGJ6_RUNSL|nr:hypothetical protein Runsl_0384 [Runella slithyformis DSM 19594]